MKLWNSLSVIGLGNAMTLPGGSGDTQLCQANSAAGCTGILCNWNGSSCSVGGAMTAGNAQINQRLSTVCLG